MRLRADRLTRPAADKASGQGAARRPQRTCGRATSLLSVVLNELQANEPPLAARIIDSGGTVPTMTRTNGFHTRTARWTQQPRHERLTLAAIIVLGVVLTSWNLARGGDSEFVAAAAGSMSESWPAFLSGAFDPGATVTLDKLAGFAVPQALSVRVFGMSTAALALPQVLEGIVTVWAVSLVGLRWAGPRVGLVAAALAASTPIFVSMFGHPMEDGLLTMALAVALVWWQRAALAGTWWPLLLSGLFVGVGFQAKMLQAWLILPALVVGTVVASGTGGLRMRRGIGHAAVLVGAAVVASLSWSVVLALLPTSAHPYFDGSTDDDVFAMVFGYNGVDRFLPGLWPGRSGRSARSVTRSGTRSGVPPGTSEPAAGTGTCCSCSPRGMPRRWDGRGQQHSSVSAWVPQAGGAVGADREARPASATLVTLVVWLVTAGVVLSVLRLPHTAYVAAVGVQLAVLAAVGWAGAARCVAPRWTGGCWPCPPDCSWCRGCGGRGSRRRADGAPVLLGGIAVGVTVVALVAVLVVGLRWGGSRLRVPALVSRLVSRLVLVLVLVAGPVGWLPGCSSPRWWRGRRASRCRRSTRRGTAAVETPRSAPCRGSSGSSHSRRVPGRWASLARVVSAREESSRRPRRLRRAWRVRDDDVRVPRVHTRRRRRAAVACPRRSLPRRRCRAGRRRPGRSAAVPDRLVAGVGRRHRDHRGRGPDRRRVLRAGTGVHDGADRVHGAQRPGVPARGRGVLGGARPGAAGGRRPQLHGGAPVANATSGFGGRGGFGSPTSFALERCA